MATVFEGGITTTTMIVTFSQYNSEYYVDLCLVVKRDCEAFLTFRFPAIVLAVEITMLSSIKTFKTKHHSFVQLRRLCGSARTRNCIRNPKSVSPHSSIVCQLAVYHWQKQRGCAFHSIRGLSIKSNILATA